MKRVALLACAVIATMGLTAASASAADFATYDQAENPYTGGYTVELSPGDEFEILSSFMNVRCEDAALDGEFWKALYKPEGPILSGTLGGCTNNYGSCASTLPGTSWNAYVHQDPYAADGEAEVVIEGFRYRFNCGGIHCEWGGTIYGQVAEIDSSPIEVAFPNPNRSGTGTGGLSKISGSFLCSSKASLVADFDFTEPATVGLHLVEYP